jgi:hypothetical protein
MPDIDDGASKWLAIGTVDYTEKMSVWCIWLVLSDDSCAIWLDGYTRSVERSENSRKGCVVFSLA